MCLRLYSVTFGLGKRFLNDLSIKRHLLALVSLLRACVVIDNLPGK